MSPQALLEQNRATGFSESIRLLRALRHLNQLLPLKYRQASLPRSLVEVHRSILRSFAERGRPLTTAEIAAMLGDEASALNALATLASKDLIVLNSAADKHPATHRVVISDPAAVEIVGAYPFSTMPTAHVVNLFGHDIFAMCALDGMSMAPMFGTQTRITSKCHVTGDTVRVHQKGMQILEVSPSTAQFGIRWQKGSAIAAHGL
ncbi:MAG TPA: organomercurial lyase [Terriglobia bacterium]|nr:organomercurial lyase [Terriglobia bacterium]